MRFTVDGKEVFAATGGRNFDPALPAMIFLHGAGSDHTVWVLLARSFAHRGYGVLAPDFPGHGRSAGPPISSIGAMADWTAAFMEAAGVATTIVVGHSMGTLVALETAARHPGKVIGLGLIATADVLRVSADLSNAAKANDRAAIDMMSLWGEGYSAALGGSPAPGLWMLGGVVRVLERVAPGVLFSDLSACNDYIGAREAAAKITVPCTMILGSRDMMTPAKNGRALAAAFANCRLTVLEGAGHMLMSERPNEVLAALRAGL